MTAIILSLSNLTVVAAVVIFLALTLLLVVILHPNGQSSPYAGR